MDAQIKKIVKMLGDERLERRCAAAMVLGELRIKDPATVEALGKCLLEHNPVLQAYVLEALAGIRTAKVAGFVTPLLDSPDDEVRAKAGAILASHGSAAANTLAKELDTAPTSRRRAIISILAPRHDKETLDRLLPLLADEEVGEYTLNAIRGESEHMNVKERASLVSLAGALLKDKTWSKDPAGVGRALRLMGYMRDPKSVRTILPFATPKHPFPVRLAALAALRRPLAASSSTAKAMDQLLIYANEPNPTLARAALDTLRGLKFSDQATDQLLQLTEGRHAETRVFALEALGKTGSQKVIKVLLSRLGEDDPTAREAASRALSRMEGIAPALVKELGARGDDPAHLQRICQLLRRQAEALTPAARKTIIQLALDALNKSRPAAEPLLELVVAVDPAGYTEMLTARALVHKKAKRFAQAHELLKRLAGKGLLTDEGRYAALISGLCMLPSKKDLGRANRSTHPLLHLLVELLENGVAVAGKLKRERALTPEDLFFIGFNFSESQDEDEQELGGALLAHLVKSSPRSKLGRSAKNKLHLVGLA